jgi:hypothetical protein
MRSADEDWYSRPSEGVLARLDQLAPLGKGLDLVAPQQPGKRVGLEACDAGAVIMASLICSVDCSSDMVSRLSSEGRREAISRTVPSVP